MQVINNQICDLHRGLILKPSHSSSSSSNSPLLNMPTASAKEPSVASQEWLLQQRTSPCPLPSSGWRLHGLRPYGLRGRHLTKDLPSGRKEKQLLGGSGGAGEELVEHQVVSVELVQVIVEVEVETCQMSLFERLSTTCCVSFCWQYWFAYLYFSRLELGLDVHCLKHGLYLACCKEIFLCVCAATNAPCVL